LQYLSTWIGDLERRVQREFGASTMLQRFMSFVAVAAALWTWLTLKFDLFQHPQLQRSAYRMSERRWSASRLLNEFQDGTVIPNVSIKVDS
jgi:biopolymer transport protein ExbB/TolQ